MVIVEKRGRVSGTKEEKREFLDEAPTLGSLGLQSGLNLSLAVCCADQALFAHLQPRLDGMSLCPPG